MLTSLTLAALLAAQPMAQAGIPPQVEGLVRLANSPVLDGQFGVEEWELFASDGPRGGAFQWEPGAYHWAAQVAQGQDLVLSLDQKGDGWLVGADNIEIRISPRADGPVVRIRLLDASSPGNPVWENGGVPPDQVKIAVQLGPDGVASVEATYTPILGLEPQEGRRVALRMDTVPTGSELSEVFFPRALTSVYLQMDSSRDIPLGVSWRPTIVNRVISRQDRLKLNFSLTREEGNWTAQRTEIRAEGTARDHLRVLTEPASDFDRRKRMDLVYESTISPQAPLGWKVVRATFTDQAGQQFIIRSSIRLANLVDIEIGFPRETRVSQEAQIIRGSINLRSQFSGRLDGVLTLIAPPEWTVTKGKESKFLIYHTRGLAKIPVEFVIPRGQAGVFPMTLKATMGGETVERKFFYSVD